MAMAMADDSGSALLQYMAMLTSDVQREIPIPSLPYGFKLFPPGNFPYGNSWEIPEIREIPELREFPVLRESREFLSY